MELKEIQKNISDFSIEKGINTKAEIRLIDLVSEVGELLKEFLKTTEYGKKSFETSKDWELELGDVFFSLLCVANESGTDLESCLERVIDKYKRRFNEKSYLDSGK